MSSRNEGSHSLLRHAHRRLSAAAETFPYGRHFTVLFSRDMDPTNNRLENLKSLCQRCHMIHDRPYHLSQRRITYLLRRALGDLFLGPYRGFG